MTQAIFRHGDPVVIDYTPSGGNVAAGDVVVVGSVTANTGGAGAFTGIAHNPIVNNTLGGLAIGGGVYDVVNLNNAPNGAKVYWDDTNNKVTTASTNNAVFGFIATNGGGGANTVCRAKHDPLYGGN
jgi:hypothetical protein